jgi:hypothetical protein
LQKYIKAFKFLKLKSRRKFFRKHKKHFRSWLWQTWDLKGPERIYALLDWYSEYSKRDKKGLRFDDKLLKEFIKRYKRLWIKRKEII